MFAIDCMPYSTSCIKSVLRDTAGDANCVERSQTDRYRRGSFAIGNIGRLAGRIKFRHGKPLVAAYGLAQSPIQRTHG
jgi:hypothetical protein